ncbi:hypothetical protein C7410_14742 [Paraburkholderia silvatlantica]|uniref:Uncharacterized protein n=1 Tax=Paraburkholderia silvatlantica TaxID=321895 RepID=A0A2V4TI75_9BURK|nr:hypothetical protein [Paraburkholderia silvatlantica]PYE13387.1 hypothetical protein C7410_14742 [Paraburkholderia silvatlantica]
MKDGERAAFEHIERASNLERYGEGEYVNPCVQSAWEGFLHGVAHARAASQATVKAEQDRQRADLDDCIIDGIRRLAATHSNAEIREFFGVNTCAAAPQAALTDEQIIEIAADHVDSDGWMNGDQIFAFARAVLSSTGGIADVEDAARYREFLDAGLPITYLGVDYHDKESLDAAIDAHRTGGNDETR